MRKIFKELHIWLSLPLGLVMSVICFSGAMLVFEKEITEMVQKEYYFVDKVSDDALSIEQVEALVKPTLSDDVEIKNVEVSEDPERCYKVNLSKPKRAAVFVDQYSGDIKGQPERLPFFRTMFRLHRWLMDTRPEGDGIYTIVYAAINNDMRFHPMGMVQVKLDSKVLEEITKNL